MIDDTKEKADQHKSSSNRDVAIRSAAIDMAICANCGQSYDDEGREMVDGAKIVSSAILFVDFITKGSKNEDF